MKIRKPFDIVIVAVVVIVILAIPPLFDLYHRVRSRERHAALSEVAGGNVIGGTLQSDREQIVCFEKSDLAAFDAAKGFIAKKLEAYFQVSQYNCSIPGPKTGHFIRDADGRQIYVTRSRGTVALWAEDVPQPPEGSSCTNRDVKAELPMYC